MSTETQPSPSQIKEKILTENTAQSVLKHLKANQSSRRRVLARWIWELLQNARDTSGATQRGLVASIAYENGGLVFQHTGRPFTMFEIGHLIFHGSTKIEDDRAIGQYGSGFLTTHLISPEIDVSGRLDDDRAFQFTIRREDGSVQELSESMDRAWQEFNASLSRIQQSKKFTTRFRYPVTEASIDAVETGLKVLECCAPFVIAFNPEFSMIEARSTGASTSVREVGRRQLADNESCSLIAVLERKDGTEVQLEYLVNSNGQTSVAVPLDHLDETYGCVPVTGIPKLFLGFPLAGTEHFSFPVVINSFAFTPTESRDGVFLGQGTDDANLRNQKILEEACGLTVDLACLTAASGWRNAHALANIPEIRDQEWLDLEWFRGLLRDYLVERIRMSPSVIARGDEPLAPSRTRLPVAETKDDVELLWQLLDGWKESRDLLPEREEASGWSRAVNSWVETQPDRDQAAASLFPEVVDGKTLASEIDEKTRIGDNYAKLQALQDLLHDGVTAVEWLDRFHQFLNGSDMEETVGDFHLVLDQSGFLDKLSALYRDRGVDEELKDIAELLDWNIRQELRAVQLSSLADEEGAGDLENDDVSRQLLDRLRARANENADEAFATASARLFAWLATRRAWERLRDFPVFTREEKSNNVMVIYTPRASGDEEPPLGPVMTLREDLQPFADILPPSRSMAVEFFTELPDLNVCREIPGAHGRTTPGMTERRHARWRR